MLLQVWLDHRNRHLHRSDQGRGVHQNRGGVSYGQQRQVEVPEQGPRVEGQREHCFGVRIVNREEINCTHASGLESVMDCAIFLSQKFVNPMPLFSLLTAYKLVIVQAVHTGFACPGRCDCGNFLHDGGHISCDAFPPFLHEQMK